MTQKLISFVNWNGGNTPFILYFTYFTSQNHQSKNILSNENTLENTRNYLILAHINYHLLIRGILMRCCHPQSKYFFSAIRGYFCFWRNQRKISDTHRSQEQAWFQTTKIALVIVVMLFNENWIIQFRNGISIKNLMRVH